MILRSVAQGLLDGRMSIIPGIVSGALELAAVSIFLLVMVETVRRSDPGFDFYDRYVVTALVAFWPVALGNPLLFYLVDSVPDTQVMIERIGA